VTELDVLMKAMEWMKENEPLEYDEARFYFEIGDIEALEEMVAGCPDSVTGRNGVGDSVDEEQYERR
jgi:hypothetical protein